ASRQLAPLRAEGVAGGASLQRAALLDQHRREAQVDDLAGVDDVQPALRLLGAVLDDGDVVGEDVRAAGGDLVALVEARRRRVFRQLGAVGWHVVRAGTTRRRI